MEVFEVPGFKIIWFPFENEGFPTKKNEAWKYTSLNKILKEDYKIRKFFENDWGTLYNKAGVSKVEIKRKVNQLELLIHAARPKAIAGTADEESTFSTLRAQIKKLTNKCTKICQKNQTAQRKLTLTSSHDSFASLSYPIQHCESFIILLFCFLLL